MVALSMADGFARLTSRPQAVIVHVDVGTQGLGAAVHNASTGRAPVLIFAGLSPHTLNGEVRGSRTEYIHWIQDVPDQKAIVGQYCRWVGECKSGRNIKDLVGRALQVAASEPRGPVYLCATREVLEEEIPEPNEPLNPDHWAPLGPSALPEEAVEDIAVALHKANDPLIITGYSGRNHRCPIALVHLTKYLPRLRILDTGGSDMCFPADHESHIGLRYGVDPSIPKADVILVLDCDVPWIPTKCSPNPKARIFHVDIDPLKTQIPTFYISATQRYRASSTTAVVQLRRYLESQAQINNIPVSETGSSFPPHSVELAIKKYAISALSRPPFNTPPTAGYLASQLRALLPPFTIFVIEAVTNTVSLADVLAPTLPGTWLNCGGGGLGWSGGAALGIKLASLSLHSQTSFPDGPPLVVNILGDGTYLFSIPSVHHWIASKYRIPVLTVVLNNRGWHAPRRSAVLVHPEGLSKGATAEELNIGINPPPDYAGIAKAAAGEWMFGTKVESTAELGEELGKAVEWVKSGKGGAIVDCRIADPV
ncbi:MAG: hypothetical protein M1814_003693 [Vezdaea aestivalis]|nr:MAG: hypothetical protein M1814_003693 [Vezdaea aestivalis]